MNRVYSLLMVVSHDMLLKFLECVPNALEQTNII